MKMSIHKKIAVTSLTVLVVSLLALVIVVMESKEKVRLASVSPKTSSHTYDACNTTATTEYILDTQGTYQLLVLCGGYTIPSDKTTAIDVDQVFLKDLTKNTYYGLMSYESPVGSSYKIEAISYPYIFIRSCWEGCSPSVMVELNQGPDQSVSYFNLRETVYRNNVNDYIGLVNGKVVMAGERKIVIFDPATFNMTTLFEAKSTESIGYSNSFPIFISSVNQKDATHIQFKVYSGANQTQSSAPDGVAVEPKEDYTKALEIR